MKAIAPSLLEAAAMYGMSKECCLGTLLVCIENSLSDHDKDTLFSRFVFLAQKLVDAGCDLSDGCRNN